VIDELLERNRRFAETAGGVDLPAPPALRVAVLTCMDARLDPARALGLEPGEAHVIRNAGGRASDDALRSLVISSHLLGTRAFAVIRPFGASSTTCGPACSARWPRRRRGERACGGIRPQR